MNLCENVSCDQIHPKTIGSVDRKVLSMLVDEINLNGADLSQTLSLLSGHARTSEWGLISNT
jgi:hypothetical protein